MPALHLRLRRAGRRSALRAPRALAKPSRGEASLFSSVMATPLGAAMLIFDDRERLRALDWSRARIRQYLRQHRELRERRLRSLALPPAIRDPLRAYFDGDLDSLGKIAVDPCGTAFQVKVWRALRVIPPGSTLTYGGLARRLGHPDAARAVGRANGANPIAIVIPCHRLIGADSALTGYGGGLFRKRWLLIHEGALAVR